MLKLYFVDQAVTIMTENLKWPSIPLAGWVRLNDLCAVQPARADLQAPVPDAAPGLLTPSDTLDPAAANDTRPDPAESKAEQMANPLQQPHLAPGAQPIASSQGLFCGIACTLIHVACCPCLKR